MAGEIKLFEKILGNTSRAKILDTLWKDSDKPYSKTKIARETKLDIRNVGKHLEVLVKLETIIEISDNKSGRIGYRLNYEYLRPIIHKMLTGCGRS
ncbi:MAG: helix-turn-helix transcriptional regulator [Methanomassiliicoccales archaeon]|nr:MAG: helix-turn-helix transcriptional regulator [Methanomassiliicoccales archaeon]